MTTDEGSVEKSDALASEGEWRYSCSPEEFARLRNEESFQLLIRLGRHLNALRYSFNAVTDTPGGTTPAETRQRSSTFINFGGILFEALELLPPLRKHFGHLPAWNDGFNTFGDDSQIRALLAQKTVLHRLRNHVSFHMLDFVPAASLQHLDQPEYVLVSGNGASGRNVYFELSDLVAAHYVCGSPQDRSLFSQKLVEIATVTRDHAMHFLGGGDSVFKAALDTFKIRLKLGKPLG